MTLLRPAALVAASVFFAAALRAGEPDEVVVTATRTATPLSEVTAPVTVITRDEIENALAADAGDLLATQAGVEVVRSGGPGQQTSIFMRGTNSNHTVVLIDGVRINPGTLGGAPIQDIQPEAIERIEIVKGARSTLYGTDAIGGVVNIITRAGADEGAGFMASAGRYGARGLAADSGTDLGPLKAGGSVAWSETDGFPTLAGGAVARGYRNLTGNLSLRYQATDQLALEGQAWRASGNTQYTGYDANFTLVPLDQDYRDASYAAAANWRAGAASLRVGLSHAEDVSQQNQSADFDATQRNTLDVLGGWQLGDRQQLSAGLTQGREHTRSLSFGTPYDVDTLVTQVFAQDQLHFGANDALLALGHTHHETAGDKTTWNLEFGHGFAGGLRLTAAAGTAFHAPDSTDRYGYGGNPALKPEYSTQYELGLRQQLAQGQSVSLNLFQDRIRNLIDYDVDYRLLNIGLARIRGAELDYQLQHDAWQLRLAGTAENPQNLDLDPQDLNAGKPLLRRARRYATLSVAHDSNGLVLGAELHTSGYRYDYGYPLDVQLGGYALLDLRVRYQILDNWSVQATLDNALDHHYELASGYNTPRRAVTLATRYRFR